MPWSVGAVFARPDGVFGFAQVGEWLKPTDCKSVPLRRYGGSNPPLCTRVAKESGEESRERSGDASVADEPEAVTRS
jgi:hypothetical protein